MDSWLKEERDKQIVPDHTQTVKDVPQTTMRLFENEHFLIPSTLQRWETFIVFSAYIANAVQSGVI